ncbi:MAG: hypothetical protein H6564_21530 [Lewinellaceae bacterium]|nr:hypothetical protein [Lewinellaceae bacterium]
MPPGLKAVDKPNDPIMESQNKIVHGLWVGPALSPLEELCLRSFVAMGHEFHLWLYEPLGHELPKGVVARPAQDILPAESIFRYRYGNQFGHGLGSLAGFSDIFRYKLLYEKGGWWADMDITCLQPLEFDAPYVFRPHDVLPVVGNLMKCPKGSPLMEACFREAQQQVTADNRDWLLPIRILNNNISRFQLDTYIIDITNKDRWEVVEYFIHHNATFSRKWYAFHWMNEEWRGRGIDKNVVPRASALWQLLVRYRIKADSLPLPFFRVPRAWRWLKKALLPRLPYRLRRAVKSGWQAMDYLRVHHTRRVHIEAREG